MTVEKANGSVSTLSKTPLCLERKRSGHACSAGDTADAEADRGGAVTNPVWLDYVLKFLSYHLLDVVAIALRAM